MIMFDMMLLIETHNHTLMFLRKYPIFGTQKLTTIYTDLTGLFITEDTLGQQPPTLSVIHKVFDGTESCSRWERD